MREGSIEIRLNGETRDVPGGLSVLALLEHLRLQPRLVVVEHNGTILRRDGYAEVGVAPGDTLELVHFVGGGRPGSRTGSRRPSGAGSSLRS